MGALKELFAARQKRLGGASSSSTLVFPPDKRDPYNVAVVVLQAIGAVSLAHTKLFALEALAVPNPFFLLLLCPHRRVQKLVELYENATPWIKFALKAAPERQLPFGPQQFVAHATFVIDVYAFFLSSFLPSYQILP